MGSRLGGSGRVRAFQEPGTPPLGGPPSRPAPEPVEGALDPGTLDLDQQAEEGQGVHTAAGVTPTGPSACSGGNDRTSPSRGRMAHLPQLVPVGAWTHFVTPKARGNVCACGTLATPKERVQGFARRALTWQPLPCPSLGKPRGMASGESRRLPEEVPLLGQEDEL